MLQGVSWGTYQCQGPLRSDLVTQDLPPHLVVENVLVKCPNQAQEEVVKGA